MNKLKAITFCSALLLFSGTAFSQSNVVKINIFSPIVKTINLSYEHVLSESSSFQLGFFYTGYKASDTKFSGFGITPEYRFYLSETEAPEGFYAAPFLRYQSFNLKDEVSDDEATFSAFGGGLVLGKQWIFKEKISLDIFLGPSYTSGNVKVKNNANEGEFDVGAFDGFSVRAGVTFGLAF